MWLYDVQQPGLHSRVQWFWLFFTFWGITTHPWHPKGPRIWKLAKKIFQLHPWPAEIFGKNRKMRFLVYFQSLILGALFDRSLPFFQHVLFMKSLILCSWGNFYGKPLAAGSHSWLPAPLECSLTDARNSRTVQNNRNEVQLLLHGVYFIRSKIHRSTQPRLQDHNLLVQ